jgi:hypothetical protein
MQIKISTYIYYFDKTQFLQSIWLQLCLGGPNLGLGQNWVWVPKTHSSPFKPLGQNAN